jgi:acyl-CoA synthetase (AMP-forming)/AMP-acid ligase II
MTEPPSTPLVSIDQLSKTFPGQRDHGQICRLTTVRRTSSTSPAAAPAGVADLAVVGVPDETWGEIVCAAVVPAGGPVPDLGRLRSHLDGRLARFKHPRRVVACQRSRAPKPPAKSSAADCATS